MRMTETVQKKNIVLIGMPASGKSTVGVILAKILGKDFIDSDIVIQKRGGAALARSSKVKVSMVLLNVKSRHFLI